jgi:hypothetical protein
MGFGLDLMGFWCKNVHIQFYMGKGKKCGLIELTDNQNWKLPKGRKRWLIDGCLLSGKKGENICMKNENNGKNTQGQLGLLPDISVRLVKCHLTWPFFCLYNSKAITNREDEYTIGKSKVSSTIWPFYLRNLHAFESNTFECLRKSAFLTIQRAFSFQ